MLINIDVNVKSLEFRMVLYFCLYNWYYLLDYHKRPPTHTCAIIIICEIKDKKIKPLLLRS